MEYKGVQRNITEYTGIRKSMGIQMKIWEYKNIYREGKGIQNNVREYNRNINGIYMNIKEYKEMQRNTR